MSYQMTNKISHIMDQKDIQDIEDEKSEDIIEIVTKLVELTDQQDDAKIITELVKLMDKIDTELMKMEENILNQMTITDNSKTTGDEVMFQNLLEGYHNELQV